MSIRVQYIFDFASPNAYLAHRLVPAIQSRTGVGFEYVPVLLGGIFKATNNVSPMVSLSPRLFRIAVIGLWPHAAPQDLVERSQLDAELPSRGFGVDIIVCENDRERRFRERRIGEEALREGRDEAEQDC